MSPPRVTIVTPSYNQAEFLEATIVSVLSQDYPNLEYMVVDGGSTDGSVSIIEKYADRLAYWISEGDSGQSSAINKGWQRATGEIVAYLNSDDTYLPGAIRAAVDFMTAHPDVGIAYGDCLAIDERGATIEKYQASPFDLDETIRRCRTPIPQPGAFIRADVLHTIGLLDESLHMAMDFDLWLRTALRYRLEYLPVTLATYRLHPASKSRSQGATTGPDVIRIYEKLLENPAFPERLRRRPRKVLSSAYLRAADEYYAAVRLRDARASWLRAWTLYPPSLGAREYVAVVNTWLRPVRRWLSAKALPSTTDYLSPSSVPRAPSPEPPPSRSALRGGSPKFAASDRSAANEGGRPSISVPPPSRPALRAPSPEPPAPISVRRPLTVFVVFRVELWRGARHWAGVSMVEGLARAGHRVVLFIRPDWLRNPIFAHLRGLGVEVRHPGHAFVGLSVTYRKVTKFIQILARSMWRRQPFAVSRRELIVRDGRELEYWWLRHQLEKAARPGRPHVVHAFGATKWTATGVEWAAAQRVPVVYTETQQVGEPEYTSILESFVHRCTAITIHGSRILEGFRRIGYTGPYKVVPFGIPSPDASPASGANNGSVVIGSASRYDPDKGLGFLIDAFSTVRRQFPDVRLVLAGEGPEHERFRGQVTSLGLELAVDIREPYDLDHGLPRFMSDIDIYCLPSLREGQPVSIIEAMAFGKPVVASDVGSVAELLDGDVGIVSPAGDSASLAAALRRLVEDPELRSAMGRRARERYTDRHRSEAVADAYLKLYESLGVTCPE